MRGVKITYVKDLGDVDRSEPIYVPGPYWIDENGLFRDASSTFDTLDIIDQIAKYLKLPEPLSDEHRDKIKRAIADGRNQYEMIQATINLDRKGK